MGTSRKRHHSSFGTVTRLPDGGPVPSPLHRSGRAAPDGTGDLRDEDRRAGLACGRPDRPRPASVVGPGTRGRPAHDVPRRLAGLGCALAAQHPDRVPRRGGALAADPARWCCSRRGRAERDHPRPRPSVVRRAVSRHPRCSRRASAFSLTDLGCGSGESLGPRTRDAGQGDRSTSCSSPGLLATGRPACFFSRRRRPRGRRSRHRGACLPAVARRPEHRSWGRSHRREPLPAPWRWQLRCRRAPTCQCR